MHATAPSAALNWFLRVATFTLVVAMLRLGRDVLMPIAFATLFAILLTPVMLRLRAWGVPRTPAILTTVLFAFGVVAALGWFVADQATRLADRLPEYEQNLQRKVAALREPHMPPSLVRAATLVDRIGKELVPARLTPTDGTTIGEPRPLPVEVRAGPPSFVAFVRDVVLPTLHPLAMAGIVVVFVVAILFQREDLRDRFIRLAGGGRINLATEAVEDASRRVSRYLGMQLVVNAAYGLPIGVGLYFIGVPNAALWGLLATLLRFVPYLGAWIAAAFPVALSLMIDSGWTMFLWTLALFIVVELISNYVIEVMVYSGTTGISGLALLVAAVFWTWLWGPGGLVLSTPLTVAALVVGKYVSGLRGLGMLLGNEPVLDPAAQFYQRLLARESEHLLDLATRHIAEHSLEEFYDRIFVPALQLAEEDRHGGTLADERQAFIAEAGRDLIEELEQADERLATEAPAIAGPPIIGFAARDDADELAARMLAHLLRRSGRTVEVVPRGADLEHVFEHVRPEETPIAFVSALPPSALLAARQMGRRLRLHRPGLPVVVGVWSATANVQDLERRLALVPAVRVATTLQSAVDRLVNITAAERTEVAAERAG